MEGAKTEWSGGMCLGSLEPIQLRFGWTGEEMAAHKLTDKEIKPQPRWGRASQLLQICERPRGRRDEPRLQAALGRPNGELL